MDVRQVIPRDAIPSVDDPAFGTDYDGDPGDRVLVYEPDEGPARAYPIRYLNYHEIVNDDADRPIAVTWCPLCGSGIVYDRRVRTVATDGVGDAAASADALTFGVSGKLADDDLVMYDRETGSEWKQSLGECIAGPLEGASLTVLPAAILEYRTFEDAYDGVVLQPPGGQSEAASPDDDPARIEYDSDPYREYERSDGFGLAAHRGEGEGRQWTRDDVDPKAVVLGLEHDGDAVGVPLTVVQAAGGVLSVTVGGRDVVVFGTDGLVAYEDPGYEFTVDDDTVRADGTTWTVATGESDDGRRLERVPGTRLFAFAWQDDHGPDSLLTAPPSG